MGFSTFPSARIKGIYNTAYVFADSRPKLASSGFLLTSEQRPRPSSHTIHEGNYRTHVLQSLHY